MLKCEKVTVGLRSDWRVRGKLDSTGKEIDVLVSITDDRGEPVREPEIRDQIRDADISTFSDQELDDVFESVCDAEAEVSR